MGFCFLGDIWVLRDPTFLAKKKNIRKRRGKGTLNTCAKFQSLNSKKRRGYLDFCAVKCKNTAWHCNYLVLVYTWYPIWGVKFDLILVLRSQFFEFLRETVHKYALEHLEAAGPEKKWVIFFLPTEMPINV